jgi:hypothetical protein
MLLSDKLKHSTERITMHEKWVCYERTSMIHKVIDYLCRPEYSQSDYTKRRLPGVHELRNYIRYTDKVPRVGLFWTSGSLTADENNERLFLNVTYGNSEYKFVESYYDAEAHVYIIHSKE